MRYCEKASWPHWAILFFACLGLYGQTINFTYVWDDQLIFLDKNSLMVEPLSWSLLSAPFLEGVIYMRPLVMFTWWLEFHLFGQNPIISHSINVILLIINVWLLRATTLAILHQQEQKQAELWATAAALIYAVHPVLIESTAWVSGRFDQLCTTGILGACLFFTHPTLKVGARLTGVSSFTIVALMSKELGVVTPVILLCLWMAMYANAQRSLWDNLRRCIQENTLIWLSVASILVLYFILRRLSIGLVYESVWGWNYLLALRDTLLPFDALRFYMGLIIWPFGKIGVFHPLSTRTLDAFAYIFIALSIAFTVLIFWNALIRKRPWAWLLLCAYAAISLVLHIIPITINDNIAQDRFLTTPLAFACMAFTLFPWKTAIADRLGLRTTVRRLSASLILGGWIIYMVFISIFLIPMWENPLTLWDWARRQNPQIATIANNYLAATLEFGRPDLTEKEIKRLTEENNGLEVGEQIIYGTLLLRKNDRESSKYLEGALYALPKFHLMPDGKDHVKNWPLNSNQFVSAYSNYALSLLIMDLDPSGALEQNKNSRWYARPGEEGYIDYIDAAIYYAIGDFKKAQELMEKNAPIYHYKKNALISQTHRIVRLFCENSTARNIKAPESCTQMEKDGFFKREYDQ